MQKSNGQIVGSLVLCMIFIVLLPVWVFGNLFVVAFPAKKLNPLAAAPIPIVSNTYADARDEDVVSSDSVAKVEIILEVANHGDGVKSSSAVKGEELVRIQDALKPEEEAKPREAIMLEEAVMIAEATKVQDDMNSDDIVKVLFESESKTTIAPLASTKIAETSSTPESRRSPEMRIWKNPSGKEVEGTLVRVMGDRIEFRTKAGKVVTSAVEYFSEADQAYIKTFEHLK